MIPSCLPTQGNRSDNFIADAHLVVFRVHVQILEAQGVFPEVTDRSPNESFQTQKQLLPMKGLDQIIVGPFLKAVNLVIDACP